MTIYECEICGGYHPWDWNSDCRDDANRYAGPDDYAKRKGINENDVEVRSMDERVALDEKWGTGESTTTNLSIAVPIVLATGIEEE